MRADRAADGRSCNEGRALKAPGKGLLCDVRGAAIYTEVLIVVPLLALLWTFANHVHNLGVSRLSVQEEARECAWAFASRGCRGDVPAACVLDGPIRLDAPDLARVAGPGLESVVRPIQSLASQFRPPSGNEIVARSTETVEPPPVFGGRRAMRGMHRMMCNDRTRAPQLPQVMDLTCNGLLGPEGGCP